MNGKVFTPNDVFQVISVKGHYELRTMSGRVILSADTLSELEDDIDEMGISGQIA